MLNVNSIVIDPEVPPDIKGPAYGSPQPEADPVRRAAAGSRPPAAPAARHGSHALRGPDGQGDARHRGVRRRDDRGMVGAGEQHRPRDASRLRRVLLRRHQRHPRRRASRLATAAADPGSGPPVVGRAARGHRLPSPLRLAGPGSGFRSPAGMGPGGRRGEQDQRVRGGKAHRFGRDNDGPAVPALGDRRKAGSPVHAPHRAQRHPARRRSGRSPKWPRC